jgi:hypothetical protein
LFLLALQKSSKWKSLLLIVPFSSPSLDNFKERSLLQKWLTTGALSKAYKNYYTTEDWLQVQDILENDLEETEKRKQQEQEHILAEIAKVSIKGTVF